MLAWYWPSFAAGILVASAGWVIAIAFVFYSKPKRKVPR